MQSPRPPIHHMRLNASPFERIANGSKKSELRLNDEKRQVIKPGDLIEFTNRENSKEKLTVRVTYLKTYPTFKDLFSSVKSDYPGRSEADFMHGMHRYYTPEEESKYGALEIGIELA